MYNAPGWVHLLLIVHLLPSINRVELFLTVNLLPTCTPLAPLFFASTYELSIVSVPADKPCEPLSLNLTTEPLVISKFEPFDPLPRLLITLILELSALTVNTPVIPERLLSLVNVELVNIKLYPPFPPSHSIASCL